MQKLLPISFIFIALFLSVLCLAAETNTTATTNTVRSPSDAELQASAKDVVSRIVVFGLFALVGAVVVAGFALYGAYRKFGVRGLIVVGIIVAFGVVALGSLLLLF